MGTMLAWFGIAAGAVYLIYIGGAWWGIYSPYLRIATVILAAVVLGIWVLVARRDPAWRPKTVMWPAIVACLVSLAVSTVFSRVPRVSLEYLGYAIVLVALYLLLVRLFARPFFRRRLATLATLLFLFTTVAFLVRVGGYWIHWWETLGRIALPPLRPGYEGLTYNNPSAALTMVALLGVPAAATLGSATRRGIAVLLAIAGAVGVVALISGSRAGWLALAVTAIGGTVAWLIPRSHRSLVAKRLGRIATNRRARLGAIATAVVAIGIVVAVAPAIVPRLVSGGEPQRIGYAIAAIRMFEQSPIVGTGPGTWVIQRPAMTTPAEADYYIPHAHNLEVQTLSELGLLGGVAGLVVVANLLWLFMNGARDMDAARRRWAWVGGIGLGYFFLHQLLDVYVNMPAFLFVAAIPVAYLDATADERAGPQRVRTVTSRARPLAVAAVAISIAGLLLQEGPALQSSAAVDAANARDWAAADAPARAAAASDPMIGSYQLTAGLTAARAGDHEAAAAYFDRAAAQSDLPEAWLDLAAEQAALGRSADAVGSLERALRIGYQRPVVSMPAGDLALRLGQPGMANTAFVASLSRTPSLAADPWWRARPDRSAAFNRALQQASAQASGASKWELLLMAGRTEDARAFAADDPSSAFALPLIDAWDGDQAAANALVSQCRANPLDLYGLLWCARLEDHRGNVESSNDLRDLANISFQSSYVGGAELRVSTEGMVGSQLVGEPADLWATYTFRRPAPWDILVPSLVHLKLV